MEPTTPPLVDDRFGASLLGPEGTVDSGASPTSARRKRDIDATCSKKAKDFEHLRVAAASLYVWDNGQHVFVALRDEKLQEGWARLKPAVEAALTKYKERPTATTEHLKRYLQTEIEKLLSDERERMLDTWRTRTARKTESRMRGARRHAQGRVGRQYRRRSVVLPEA